MSRGIIGAMKDICGKQDAPLWLNATKPQLVVDGHERPAHA
jgi:hypothetical protein